MIIHALQHIHMQGNPRLKRKALETMVDHLGAQVADFLAREFVGEVGDEVGAVGEVDDGAGEGLVKGRVGGAEAAQTGAGAQGGAECKAQGEEGVFGGVVVVDWVMLVCVSHFTLPSLIPSCPCFP